jgi:hypothetical protein
MSPREVFAIVRYLLSTRRESVFKLIVVREKARTNDEFEMYLDIAEPDSGGSNVDDFGLREFHRTVACPWRIPNAERMP